MYVPNPLRYFNCHRFGHHENICPVDIRSVYERCGIGGDDHHTNHVQTQQNVSVVGMIIYQGPVNVKFGKKKKKS